jgi:hypothetical protein
MISRNKSLALFLILSIFLACGFLYVLNITQAVKEGFEDVSLETSYKQLQTSLQKILEPYCSLTNFVQDQMKTMFQATKVSESGDSVPGDTDQEANEHIKIAYKDAYACRDELASSRASCAGTNAALALKMNMDFIPCSVYMSTPTYDDSDTSTAAIALSDIPDNLALRITKEIDWYASIIKKLQDGLDAGANPPTSLPPDAPGADYKPPPDKSAPPGAVSKKEGFAGGKCSPEAMRIRQQKMRQKMQEKMMREQANRQQNLDAESDNCSMPELQSEIDRVSGILNSDALKKAISRCAEVAEAAKKLQRDLALLKEGKLYAWQKSGPKKSYAQFKGGDRIAGLTFSLQQNR